jgi:hypothetical protein
MPMCADQPRNRTVGSKMTDSEYERLAAVAEQDGQTLGEWCREVLLERAEGRKPSAIEEALLAEALALRTILLNAFYKLALGVCAFCTGLSGSMGHIATRRGLRRTTVCARQNAPLESPRRVRGPTPRQCS